ncbi:MAG: 4Fe-4S binding protein [Acidobacteria bacterium]|nr:4Fe-4S binding protein [Acidobacteriota bacterium]
MRGTTLTRLRLTSQIVFFLLFIFLLARTEFPGSVRSASADIKVPYPVGLFLETDPLVALTTAISTHTLYRHLLWAVPFVLLAVVVGRGFCGWVCPMGTLHHFVGSWKSESKRGVVRLDSNRYKRCAALDAAYGLPLGPTRIAMDGVSLVLGATILSFKQPHFNQAVFTGLVLLFLLALNLRVTRFWCRAICPLGGLLGVLSRWSLVQLRKHDEQCNDCRRCLLHCQGGDDPIPGAVWRKAECHLCMNCLGECPEGGLSFAWAASAAKTTREVPQLQRRAVITSLVAGAGLLPLLRTGPGLKAAGDAFLIRPPGSLDEGHFLERCIRCGDCMKVCPNNALHPALGEGGVEGIWTPVLVPRIGYCEPNCTLCSQVCPTGAIWEITVAEKTGRPTRAPSPAQTETPATPSAEANPIRIGTAFYDRGRCLPWAMATECIVCEEWCPTSPKAIYLVPAEVADPQGQTKTVRQPYVDPKRCTGCGACEYACPIKGRPAVYVTSAGESRSKTNQFLLRENQPPARTS